MNNHKAAAVLVTSILIIHFSLNEIHPLLENRYTNVDRNLWMGGSRSRLSFIRIMLQHLIISACQCGNRPCVST